jgi:mannose-6-phosphate isomerase-like protein (cupin superfamily)
MTDTLRVDCRRVIPSAQTPVGVTIFRHGTLDVKLAIPARPNVQAPHAQDEVYIVVRGRGVLFHDGRRDPFEPGDFLFVAAGVDHHFEDNGPDLLVWRVFYGPDGGEIAG